MKKLISMLLSVAMLLTVGVGMEMTASAADVVYEYGGIKIFRYSYQSSTDGYDGSGYAYRSTADSEGAYLLAVGHYFIRGGGEGYLSSSWKVSDTSVIKIVASSSTKCMIQGVAPGKTNFINVVQAYDASVGVKTLEVTHKIKVVEPLTSMTLSTDKVSLSVGGTQRIYPTAAVPDSAESIYFTSRSYSSSNTSVATVDDDGNITAVGAGTATISLVSDLGTTLATCTVTVTDPASSNAVTTASNSSSSASSSSGSSSSSSLLSSSSSSDSLSSSSSTTVKKTSIKKLTKKNKGFKVTWNKKSSVTGYQVQYATNKKFTKNKKTVTVKGASKTSKTIKGLKSKKTYYVRIRTYKTVNGKKVYSNWSTVKKVKTK